MNSPDPAPARWNFALRLAFRFLFCYFLLYSLPSFLGLIPAGDYLAMQYSRLWQWLVTWLAAHLLRPPINITVFPNGSGDTTYNYVEVACFGAIALLATGAWSILDRRRLAYPRLHDCFRIYLRYVLAATMLGYGFAKVIKTQFPFPGADRLLEPYGESSPMGLLWTFMGYSTPYTVFAGAAEVLGGLLLLFRRTTLAGALVVAGVMVNVAMLNFCYDVPVKLYSSHLLIMSLVLMAPDLHRLAAIFILNRPVPAAILRRVCDRRWIYITAMVLKTLFVVFLLGSSIYGGVQTWSQYGPGMPPKPLQGLYEVAAFSRDGSDVPPLYTDATRWRRFVVGEYGNATIHYADDSKLRQAIAVDPAAHTLTLSAFGPSSPGQTLRFAEPEAGRLTLDGSFQGHTLHIELTRRELSTFPLVSRGFHWINEYPFNR